MPGIAKKGKGKKEGKGIERIFDFRYAVFQDTIQGPFVGGR
jgi:hypothetical protein